MTAKVVLLRTLESLHVGTGQGAGFIDLEIMREKATGWPVVPGSSVKGVLKDLYRGDYADDAPEMKGLFGFTGDEGTTAGSLVFSDLQCVVFPVRSYYGTFAYVTCPLAIQRLNQHRKLAGGQDDIPVPTLPNHESAKIRQQGSVVGHGRDLAVFLEDIRLPATCEDNTALAAALAQIGDRSQEDLEKRLVVVSDTLFTSLVKTCTEVVTHVTLQQDTKTALKGGLRVEESVPAEAFFAGLLRIERVGNPELAQMWAEERDEVLQFGGKASTGNGLCRFKVVS